MIAHTKLNFVLLIYFNYQRLQQNYLLSISFVNFSEVSKEIEFNH